MAENAAKGNTITLTITLDEEVVRTRVQFDLSDVPDETMPFCHALMDGMLILLNDPEDVAARAVEAYEAATLLHRIQEGKTSYDDTEEAPKPSDNVVRLH